MADSIYIISNGKQYKVGFSKNPTRRVKQLQTGCADKLELKYSIEIEKAPIRLIELVAHKQFGNRILGEWFDEDYDKLKNTIDYIKMRYDNEETAMQYKYGVLNYFE